MKLIFALGLLTTCSLGHASGEMSPVQRGGSCQTQCVAYCSNYDRWPFQDRCLSRATECGPNAEVVTACGEYDVWPFQDRCLQQEDYVSTNESCND